MISGAEGQDRERESLARLLECSAWCLFLVFITAMLAGLIPPRLLDPAWQLRFAGLAVNNGSIPLVGFLLMALASAIAPADGALRSRRDRVRQWGLAAALGFLLLMPLQAFAAWRAYGNATFAQGRQLQAAERKFVELRQAILAAGSPEDLQARFQRLQGPPLNPADLGQPLPQLRRQLLASLEAAQTRVRDQLGGPPAERVWLLIQDSVRVVLTALGYGVAFAAGSYLPGRPEPLLDSWSRLLQDRRNRRLAARRQREATAATAAPPRKDIWKPRRAPGQKAPGWLESLFGPKQGPARSAMPRPRRNPSRKRGEMQEYWRQMAAEDSTRRQRRRNDGSGDAPQGDDDTPFPEG